MSFGAALNTYMSCNKAGAIPQLQSFLSSNPNHFDANMLLASSYSIVGNKEQALATYKNACKRSTNGAEKLIYQGFVDQLSGKSSDATTNFARAAQDYPRSAPAQYYQGHHLQQVLGHKEQAIPFLEKSVGLGYGKVSYANFELGEIYWKKGGISISSTYKAYERAVTEIPSMTIGYLGMTKCWLRDSKQPSTGEKYFTKAQQLNAKLVPEYVQFKDLMATPSLELKGVLYWHSGDCADLTATMDYGAFDDTLSGLVNNMNLGGSASGGGGSGGGHGKGSIPDQEARNLYEQLAIETARGYINANISSPDYKKQLPQHTAQRIMAASENDKQVDGLTLLQDAPRLRANYGNGTWEKWHYALKAKSPSGEEKAYAVVHWFRNANTGQGVEYKFKWEDIQDKKQRDKPWYEVERATQPSQFKYFSPN